MTAAGAAAPTFADFAKDWTSGGLRKKYPTTWEKKDGSEDGQISRDRFSPWMGNVRLPDVTLQHAERVMMAFPPGTRARGRSSTSASSPR